MCVSVFQQSYQVNMYDSMNSDKKEQAPTQSFYFPQNEQLFYIVRDISELKNLLESQRDSSQRKFKYFKISLIRNTYIYIRCSKCQSKIKYKFNNVHNYFELVYFKNFHKHIFNRKQVKNQQIENMISNLPIQMQIKSKMLLVRDCYGISKAQFYYLNKKVEKNSLNFKNLIQQLDQSRYYTHYDPFPLTFRSIPNIFITASQEMRQMFKLYGQAITFDITYNLIRQRQVGQNHKTKQYGFGFFVGLSCANKIICFAIAIVNDQSSQTFFRLFKSFFQIMESQPQTILTDQQPSIIKALNDLIENNQYHGVHLHDVYHVEKNLKKKTKNKRLLIHLHSAMFATNNSKYLQYLSAAQQCIQNQRQASIVDNFVRNAHKFCFSRVPNRYIGLTICTSHQEKLNDLIKQVLQYERAYTIVVLKALKLSKRLINKCHEFQFQKNPYEQIFNYSELKRLRFLVCKRVYRILLEKYAQSLEYRIERNQQDRWVIFNQSSNFEVKQDEGQYLCQCNYQIKSGVPCEHLILLCRTQRMSVSQLISNRWKLPENLSQITSKKIDENFKRTKGRPKLSRRNWLL